jgi:hypothetical protein
MKTDLGPAPRSPAKRAWNGLVHRVAPVRWVDEWWWERARVPMELGGIALEAGIWAIGLTVLPLPTLALMTLARIGSHADEIHMAWNAIKHRDISLFNQPQTWERTRDGRMVRLPDAIARDEERRLAEEADPDQTQARLKGWLTDYLTERRRMPAFILGLGLPLVGMLAGSVFGVSMGVSAAIAYTGFAAQYAPTARNLVRAVIHRSWSYVNQPQRHHRRPRAETQAPTVTAPTVDTPATPACGTDQPAAPPSPTITPMLRRLPGHARAMRIHRTTIARTTIAPRRRTTPGDDAGLGL